jgi:predicted ATPase
MKFHFENLGAIKKADIEVGNLTVICGKNNTGKTYLSYAVWGLLNNKHFYPTTSLNFVKEIFMKTIEKLNLIEIINENTSIELDLKYFENDFKNYLNEIFNKKISNIFQVFKNDKTDFINTKIEFDKNFINFNYNEEYNAEYRIFTIKKERDESLFKINLNRAVNNINENILISLLLFLLWNYLTRSEILIFTAQRESIFFFKNYVEKVNSEIVTNLQLNKNDNDFLNHLNYLPLPLNSNIDIVREFSQNSTYQNSLNSLANEVENLLEVKFNVIDNQIYIENNNSNIPINFVSSSIRQLAGLHYFIKHIANKNQLLMIDEPELGLHPENQVKLARLLVKLVNAGVKVWITTHSDFIIKEFNNLLMLSNDIPEKKALLEEFGYQEDEILKKEDFRPYIAYYDKELGGCTVKLVEIDEYGMKETTFDDEIDNINHRTHVISNAIFDKNIIKND